VAGPSGPASLRLPASCSLSRPRPVRSRDAWRESEGDVARQILAFERVATRLGGDVIFDALTFAADEGEVLCILGPSGCGKSTALRLMGDLLPIQGGRVAVDGKAPAEAWRALAYVFQSPRLVPWRTALANVVLGMELRYDGMRSAEMERRARELLALV